MTPAAIPLGINFTLCLSELEFRRELNRCKLPANKIPSFIKAGNNATTHIIEHGGNVSAIVCLDDSNMDGIQIAALLVHEAVHIWQCGRDLIGEEHPGIELEAYAIQHISQDLMNLYAAMNNRWNKQKARTPNDTTSYQTKPKPRMPARHELC